MSAAVKLPTGQMEHVVHKAVAGRATSSLATRVRPTTSQLASQGKPTTPPAIPGSQPNGPVLAGSNTSPPTMTRAQTITGPSAENPSNLSSQARRETQTSAAVGSPISPPSQVCGDTQKSTAGRGPILADPFLGILAATVDDLEENRKGLANRYRQLTRATSDVDGRMRGLGLDESAPEVKLVRHLLVAIGGEKLDGSGGIEHQAILKLNGRMRKHPLWKSWGIHQKGVGEKQLARLLASIGDPYWNDLHDRPRTVSELWSYCGYSVLHSASQAACEPHGHSAGGVAPKKARGAKVNWSSNARMRTWNIFGSCLKAQGDYSQVYYVAREKYENATHSVDCTRCGPKGKPALVGSPLSDGHKHARAIRITCKEILRDLWVASKALHEAE